MSKKDKKKEYYLFKIDEKTAEKLGLATGIFKEQLVDNFCLVTEKGKIYQENDMAIVCKPNGFGDGKKNKIVNDIAEAYAFYVHRFSQNGKLDTNEIIMPELQKKYNNPVDKIKANKVSDILIMSFDAHDLVINEDFVNNLDEKNDFYKKANKALKEAAKEFEKTQKELVSLFLTNAPTNTLTTSVEYDTRDDYFSEDEDYEEDEDFEDDFDHDYDEDEAEEDEERE